MSVVRNPFMSADDGGIRKLCGMGLSAWQLRVLHLHFF